jgi:tol-pal system protein YbgF
LPLLFALSACAGNDVIVQRQSKIEGRIEQVMQAQNSSKNEISALSLQIKELKELVAKNSAADNDAKARYDALQSRVEIMTQRLAQVETATRQSATIELVNNESGAADRGESVQAEYMKAFGLFSVNNYTAAIDAFTAFIANHPESEYAVNARYWLGECYFSTGRFRESIDTFTRIVDMNPSAKRTADAQLKIGLAWENLDDTAKSSAALRTVIDKFPESEAAVQARKRLDRKL